MASFRKTILLWRKKMIHVHWSTSFLFKYYIFPPPCRIFWMSSCCLFICSLSACYFLYPLYHCRHRWGLLCAYSLWSSSVWQITHYTIQIHFATWTEVASHSLVQLAVQRQAVIFPNCSLSWDMLTVGKTGEIRGPVCLHNPWSRGISPLPVYWQDGLVG